MAPLRVGTRGSDLARRQAMMIVDLLRAAHPSIELELVIVATDGDMHPDRPIDERWPPGSFVGAIEQALLEQRVDLAVHSCKDLQTAPTAGLRLAALPPRGPVHDVLITAERVELDDLPRGLRIGTSSVRRAAQLRRQGPVEPVPIRGNVPTRLARVGAEVDGVVLAAAGLERLGLAPKHAIDLSPPRFLPAPAQGALAVQAREDDEGVIELLAAIDDAATHRAVAAERAMLARLEGGCRTAVGALAEDRGDHFILRGQLFAEGHVEPVEGELIGSDPDHVGPELAERLRRNLPQRSAAG